LPIERGGIAGCSDRARRGRFARRAAAVTNRAREAVAPWTRLMPG